MAVVNTKATGISNADQLYPKVPTASYLGKSPIFATVGTVEVGATDDVASVYRFVRVPSGARIHSLNVFSDAISGMSAVDVGIYNPQNEVGGNGAVVSDNLFADGIDLSVQQTEPYDVIFNNLGVENIGKRVWELLALTADPLVQYDICLTADTISSSSGTISVQLEFVI